MVLVLGLLEEEEEEGEEEEEEERGKEREGGREVVTWRRRRSRSWGCWTGGLLWARHFSLSQTQCRHPAGLLVMRPGVASR